MSRKRIPLNQNGCTANFRIGVPFEQNLHSIKPGESVQLNMAWIVNESDLKNLYLNVTGDGASYEFSEYILKKGLVDIRK